MGLVESAAQLLHLLLRMKHNTHVLPVFGISCGFLGLLSPSRNMPAGGLAKINRLNECASACGCVCVYVSHSQVPCLTSVILIVRAGLSHPLQPASMVIHALPDVHVRGVIILNL